MRIFPLHPSQKKGFTLVELLVATGVFVAIMTVSLGSVVSILDAGRKARSLKSVMTNLNFTVEAMSREIKFGTNYYCGVSTVFPPTPQNCTGQNMAPQPSISFVSSEDVNIVYQLVGTQIQKSIDGGVTFLGVTAPEVVIQDLKFFVFNSSPQTQAPADNAQPRVIILIRGYAGNRPSSQSNFILQTTVSQRVPDGSPIAIVAPPTGYRFVKWDITQRRCSENSVQMADIVLLNNGSQVSWPGGTIATNPGGNNPVSEVPSNGIDGITGTKWLDFNFDTDGGDPTFGSSKLVIDTGSGNSVVFNGYRWTTANDMPCRDPIGWTMYGSNDGASYTPLDVQSNQTNDPGRNTAQTTYSF
jgi:prepilin-type N-terminal cleavage/methylation domain-containing protein